MGWRPGGGSTAPAVRMDGSPQLPPGVAPSRALRIGVAASPSPPPAPRRAPGPAGDGVAPMSPSGESHCTPPGVPSPEVGVTPPGGAHRASAGVAESGSSEKAPASGGGSVGDGSGDAANPSCSRGRLPPRGVGRPPLPPTARQRVQGRPGCPLPLRLPLVHALELRQAPAPVPGQPGQGRQGRRRPPQRGPRAGPPGGRLPRQPRGARPPDRPAPRTPPAPRRARVPTPR